MNISRSASFMVCLPLLFVAGSDAYSRAEDRSKRDMTAEEVLAAYQAGCAAVTSFDVVAKVTSQSLLEPIPGEPPETPLDRQSPTGWKKVDPTVVRQAVSRQRYSEGRFRLDCVEIDGRAYAEGSLVNAWNKDVFKRLSLSTKSGSVQNYAQTQNGPHVLAYQNLFLSFDGDYSYVSFIHDRQRTCKRDGNCFALTAHPAPESKIRASRFGLRLSLDPARGFMPTRGAYLVDGERWPQSEWTNELYEPKPGVWVPKAGTFQVILREKDSEFAGTPLGKTTLEIDVERARFNTKIDAAVFNIDFPPNLRVADEVRK